MRMLLLIPVTASDGGSWTASLRSVTQIYSFHWAGYLLLADDVSKHLPCFSVWSLAVIGTGAPGFE